MIRALASTERGSVNCLGTVLDIPGGIKFLGRQVFFDSNNFSFEGEGRPSDVAVQHEAAIRLHNYRDLQQVKGIIEGREDICISRETHRFLEDYGVFLGRRSKRLDGRINHRGIASFHLGYHGVRMEPFHQARQAVNKQYGALRNLRKVLGRRVIEDDLDAQEIDEATRLGEEIISYVDSKYRLQTDSVNTRENKHADLRDLALAITATKDQPGYFVTRRRLVGITCVSLFNPTSAFYDRVSQSYFRGVIVVNPHTTRDFEYFSVSNHTISGRSVTVYNPDGEAEEVCLRPISA